jgi:hypothetical protein
MILVILLGLASAAVHKLIYREGWMRIEIHIKQEVAQLCVPRHQKVKWIVEAALLWHQERTGVRTSNELCIAKRANGDGLNVS